MKSKREIISDKIMPLPELLRECAGWRVKSKRIVFTNGCFDILHPGHVQLLLEAAEFGTKLIVGLNADASVRKLKGAGRPVNSWQARALLLAAQAYVDAVAIFEEETPIELIQALRPDVLVKGGDYKAETVVGAELVKSYGGDIKIVPLVDGFSTTRIIEGLK
jgi:D-beta-D-heptose 7-phosphate kinase/D-beta-D-heptose 1-phosphate adenosyltransferase